MGATMSQCTDGWRFITEQPQLQERVNALEQKCATADASYSALQSKCSEVERICEQLQMQIRGNRIEMQHVLLQLEKVEQRMETMDLQQNALMEDTDMVVLSSK
jgi:chromosome segregation ATPase